MSLGHILDRKLRVESVSAPAAVNYHDINTTFSCLESAFSVLERANSILHAAKNYALTAEEIRFGHHSLNLIPEEFRPSQVRMEHMAVTRQGLVLRSEGVVDSILKSIKIFFKWISDAFSKVFGGGDSSDSTSGGGAGVAAATAETITTAKSNGVDEFYFKASSQLFKLLNLNDLKACHSYYDAIAASSKALIDIQESAIKFSEKGGKEYQGDFRKDALIEMGRVVSSKSDSYSKSLVRSSELKDGTYFAFPVGFNTARVLVVTEQGVSTPSESSEKSSDDQVGEGFTPKDVYISTSDYKRLVDHFAQSSKLFYDRDADLKKLSEGYERLSKTVENWAAMEPETAKLVGEGLKELNKIGSFTIKAFNIQKTNINKLVAALKSVNENELRDQAKAARKDDADKAESDKKNAEAQNNKIDNIEKAKARIKEIEAKGNDASQAERNEMKRLRTSVANGKF